MNAHIITIGDEILIGQIIDTNSAFISKELIKIGIEVTKIVSIGDSKKAILSSLKDSQNNCDIAIITGGLGPTNDDITKDSFCEFFDDELVHNPEILRHIEKLFKKFVDNPINDLNRNQAFLPSKAKLIPNLYGTAAGMSIKAENTLFISLPGVPYEMKSMVTDFIIPQIQKDVSDESSLFSRSTKKFVCLSFSSFSTWTSLSKLLVLSFIDEILFDELKSIFL